MITVRIDGRVYMIPTYWLIGASRSLGSYAAAIRHWHEQELLRELLEESRV